MVPAVRTFQYQLQDVRVVEQDGEPWFVEADVRRALGIPSNRSTVRLLDREKGRHRIKTPGGPQQMNIVSESGLYKLIMRSDKEEAEPFQEWVTGTVLPEIRRTGHFAGTPVQAEPPTDIAGITASASCRLVMGMTPRPSRRSGPAEQ
jgi:anti-repressor protein